MVVTGERPIFVELLTKEVTMYSKYTQDLDDKYGWNDPFLTSRTLSQPNTVGAASVRKHRPDSTAPVLHGK